MSEKNPYLHTPAASSSAYVRWASTLRNNSGPKFGCVLDKFVRPLGPGTMLAVAARPGMGKSTFMAYMAMKEARRIMAAKADDEIVVYVTWEQPVEELEAFFQSSLGGYSATDMAWGRLSEDIIRANAIPRAALPLWTIGASIEQANVKKPKMYIESVLQTIEEIHEKYGKRVTLACLDYLQIIPVPRTSNRIDQVSEAAYLVKQTAMQIGAPVIVGVQAARHVDDYKYQIPQLGDMQHSSAIEQTCDTMFGLWRPIRSKDPDEESHITIGGRDYDNTENLFVVRLLKQRQDRGFGVWAMSFNPATLEMHDYVTHPL